MKRPICSLILLGSLFAPIVPAMAAPVSDVDKVFVTNASQGGMTEVELGKIAGEKGTSPTVKDFGAKMVTDHGQANDTLKALATSKGITLPSSLDASHQAIVDKFTSMPAKSFDDAYIQAMVKAHVKDDKLFATEAKTGQDTDIKEFASKTDLTVKKHLKMAQQMSPSMASK